MLATLRLSPIHRFTASGGIPTSSCEPTEKRENGTKDLMPRYTRKSFLKYLVSVRQTLKRSPPPEKSSDSGTHSRSVIVESGCPILLMTLGDHVNDEVGGGHGNGVLNLLRDWLVAPTWSSVRPMALRSSWLRVACYGVGAPYVASESILIICFCVVPIRSHRNGYRLFLHAFDEIIIRP